MQTGLIPRCGSDSLIGRDSLVTGHDALGLVAAASGLAVTSRAGCNYAVIL